MELRQVVKISLTGDKMTEMKELKKHGKLKDGTVVLLRPMVRADRKGLGEFFSRLTPSVLQYVRNDVTDPKVLDKWFDQLNYDRVFPLLAFRDDKLVANASLWLAQTSGHYPDRCRSGVPRKGFGDVDDQRARRSCHGVRARETHG